MVFQNSKLFEIVFKNASKKLLKNVNVIQRK